MRFCYCDWSALVLMEWVNCISRKLVYFETLVGQRCWLHYFCQYIVIAIFIIVIFSTSLIARSLSPSDETALFYNKYKKIQSQKDTPNNRNVQSRSNRGSGRLIVHIFCLISILSTSPYFDPDYQVILAQLDLNLRSLKGTSNNCWFCWEGRCSQPK